MNNYCKRIYKDNKFKVVFTHVSLNMETASIDSLVKVRKKINLKEFIRLYL